MKDACVSRKPSSPRQTHQKWLCLETPGTKRNSNADAPPGPNLAVRKILRPSASWCLRPGQWSWLAANVTFGVKMAPRAIARALCLTQTWTCVWHGSGPCPRLQPHDTEYPEPGRWHGLPQAWPGVV